ncbi:MAG TPA: DUF5946 family protein [Pyrinomonadaceae bacterium]|nr:DUF5946 family protein [Pyrinomonadaceae bacterium]
MNSNDGSHESICPGCGLSMPIRNTNTALSYYNTSVECWDLYTEVLATEYSNAFLFGQVHQLTVDAYAVQHAGGPHPDKSVDIHLCGLHLSLVDGIRSPYVPPMLQRLAGSIKNWPHYNPVNERTSLTVFEVAMSDSVEEQIRVTREWAKMVWDSWAEFHAEVAALISHHLKAP